MEQFQLKLIINIVIGIIFVIGFITFMFKRTNWFKPGGIVYEFLKSRNETKQTANQNKDDSNK